MNTEITERGLLVGWEANNKAARESKVGDKNRQAGKSGANGDVGL